MLLLIFNKLFYVNYNKNKSINLNIDNKKIKHSKPNLNITNKFKNLEEKYINLT